MDQNSKDDAVANQAIDSPDVSSNVNEIMGDSSFINKQLETIPSEVIPAFSATSTQCVLAF